MEKQIKDYLPYYIGQDVKVVSKTTGAEWPVRQLLGVIIDKEDCLFFTAQNEGLRTSEYLKLFDVKLLLRQLPDMEREHLLEVMTMCYRDVYGHDPVFTDIEHLSSENGGGLVAIEDDWRYGITVTETGIDFSANGSFLNHNPFEITHKLYKWGYDLHGLIPAGLAIDKSKTVSNE